MSSARLERSVVICETETRGATNLILSRRLTSDQGHRKVYSMPRLRQPHAEGRIRHRTMAEFALEQLREAIILGELPAGTPLRLDELARSLGMSISPIREAVRQLEALGLAKHVPHPGAKGVPIDVDELRDLFTVRLVLESEAVRRAAVRFADEDASLASAQLAASDLARESDDVREALAAHTEFHFAIYGA